MKNIYLPSTGGSFTIATTSVKCISNIRVTQGGSLNGFSTATTVSNEVTAVTVTVSQNNTGAAITESGLFSYSASSNECSEEITWHQLKGQHTCSCSDLTMKIPTYKEYYVDVDSININECNGGFELSIATSKKSDGTRVNQVQWDENGRQELEHGLQISDEPHDNHTDEYQQYSYTYTDEHYEATPYEGTIDVPPCYTGCVGVSSVQNYEYRDMENGTIRHSWYDVYNENGDPIDVKLVVMVRNYISTTDSSNYNIEERTISSGSNSSCYLHIRDDGYFNGDEIIDYLGYPIVKNNNGDILSQCD